MNKTKLLDWLKLCNVGYLGPRKILRLFQLFKDIDTIKSTSNEKLIQTRIFNEKMIDDWDRLKNASSENFQNVINTCEEQEIRIIPIFSDEYPEQLRNIPYPPRNILVQGRKELLYTKKVAIVGSRKSDENAKAWAFELSKILALKGITIVSGGAKGIDYEAHRGALSVGGNTICVIGTGMLNHYPEEHLHLFAEIREKGLLITEHLPNFTGSKFALLQRNRIISGLSQALCCVTCGLKSGAMTQLSHAYEQRVPIFAPIPEFGFTPREGLDEKRNEYKIREIENEEPLLEEVRKDDKTSTEIQFTLI